MVLMIAVLTLLGCPRLRPSDQPMAQTVAVGVADTPAAMLSRLPAALVQVRSFCGHAASAPDSSGTAFIVGHSDGWAYLISARHVLFPDACRKQLAQRVQLRGEGVRDFDGEPQPLIQLQTRPEDDLILLRARGDKRTPAVELGVLNTDMLGNGADPIEAFGFSLLHGSGALPLPENRRGTVARSLRDQDYREVLVTTAKLLPGMSGGPVALRSSGLVFGVVLGEYEGQKGGTREGRIASLTSLYDQLPEALRQQLGIVLHHPVSAAYQPNAPKATWIERPEQKDALAVLDASKPGQEPAKLLLHGIGGVGKTTLAYQLAVVRRDRFPGGTIIVELKNRLPELVLSDLLEAITGHRPQPGDWFKLLSAQLVQLPSTLVILDNVRLDEEPWSQHQTMDALLQTLGPATLIMTSRSRQAPAGFTPIEINSLAPHKATELALKLAQAKRIPMSPSQASELGIQLGGLPFALERAVELMHDENHSPESLLAKFRQDGRDPEKRLAQILDWSYQALDGEAKAVLIAMGQLAEAPVPEVLLDGLLPKLHKSQRAKGINRLLRSGLMDRTSPGASTYHQHTLLWEWVMKLGLEKHHDEVQAIQQRVAESLKTHDAQVAPLLIEHLLTAQRLAEQRKQPDRVLSFIWGADKALDTFGYWSARKELLQRGLRAAQKSTDRKILSDMYLLLGNVAWSQGDYGAARQYYQDSLALSKELGDRSGIATTLMNLGNVAASQADYGASRAYYQDSLALYKEIGGRSGIAQLLGNLGTVVASQGDYAAARMYFQDSLARYKELGDRQGIATNLMNLGNVALSQGDYGAASTYYQDSLSLRKELGDRLGIATVLNNLGELARLQGDDRAARKHCQDSLTLQKQLGDRSGIANTLMTLGSVALSQGDYAAARTYLQTSLALQKQLGDRSGTAIDLMNLGIVAEGDGTGGLDTAEKYFGEAWQLAASLSACNWILGKSLWGLGRVAAKRGKNADARQYVDQAIQIFQRLGDPALPTAQQFRTSLGSATDPAQCRKACEELQAQAELVASVLECVKKLCAD